MSDLSPLQYLLGAHAPDFVLQMHQEPREPQSTRLTLIDKAESKVLATANWPHDAELYVVVERLLDEARKALERRAEKQRLLEAERARVIEAITEPPRILECIQIREGWEWKHYGAAGMLVTPEQRDARIKQLKADYHRSHTRQSFHNQPRTEFVIHDSTSVPFVRILWVYTDDEGDHLEEFEGTEI